MPYRYLVTCLTFIIFQEVAIAQVKNDSLNIYDGIYFTLETLRANKPDISLNDLTIETRQSLYATEESTLRLTCLSFQYLINKGEISQVPISKAWVIAKDGRLFVRNALPLKSCFERLLTIGRLSRFFTRKDTEGHFVSNPYGGVGYVPPKIKVKEFVVDLSTGKVYNMNSELGKVRSIIKEDKRFANERITGKNIDDYINQFNKLHPIIPNTR